MNNNVIKRLITAGLLATLFLVLYIYTPPYVLSGAFLCICATILATEWPQLIQPFYFSTQVLFTSIYLIAPFYALIALNQNTHYRILVLVCFSLVAAADTGAYITGKLFGSHKLCPNISPQKTWEGVFGGLIFTYCAFIITLRVLGTPINWLAISMLTPIICTLALGGDLFESCLKRNIGIKDSGTVLPGHGGLLDRLDGVLPVALFFWIFKDLLMHVLF